jgi:hypothetical protein
MYAWVPLVLSGSILLTNGFREQGCVSRFKILIMIYLKSSTSTCRPSQVHRTMKPKDHSPTLLISFISAPPMAAVRAPLLVRRTQGRPWAIQHLSLDSPMPNFAFFEPTLAVPPAISLYFCCFPITHINLASNDGRIQCLIRQFQP